MAIYGYAFLFLIQSCYGAVPTYEIHEKKDVQECVAGIIQRVDATDVALINVKQSFAKELHSLLEHRVKFISRSFYWPNDTLSNDVYVIQCTDFLMFSHGLDLVKRYPFWNPRTKFIIIIEHIEDFLQDVSDFLLNNHMYDVALVVYAEVYTFGLERDECDAPVAKILRLLSRCCEVQSVDKIYVAERKTSLRGCHAKFVSHDYLPFISFRGSPGPGIEQYIVQLIAQYEYITVQLVNFGKSQQFGERLDNYTYSGMLHEIEIYNVEGAIGGYTLTSNRIINFDFVYPFFVGHYKIVVGRAKVLDKYSAVLKQLGAPIIWGELGTFCIVCVIVSSMGMFRKRVKDTSRDILIMCGYFLNNVPQKLDTKTRIPHRLVLLSTLLYVFVISCAIQAYLMTATTKPIRDFQPDTIEEVTSDFHPILSPSVYAILRTNPVVHLKNANVICKSAMECIMLVAIHEDKALYTISSDIYYEGYIWKFADDYGELKIHTISEPVGITPQTVYIRKGSSLTEPFNRLLLRARSAGLIDKYVDRIHFEDRLKYKFRVRIKEPQSLKGLKGVYMLLISGYCISAISFVIEKWHKLR